MFYCVEPFKVNKEPFTHS